MNFDILELILFYIFGMATASICFIKYYESASGKNRKLQRKIQQLEKYIEKNRKFYSR